MTTAAGESLRIGVRSLGNATSEAGRLSRLRSGDETAWAEVVAEVGPTLVGYARSRGVPDPEDLLQDVFVAAAAGLNRFKGDWRAFRSWLFSIAYRQIVNRYRAADPPEELPDTLPDPTPSPEDTVVRGSMASAAIRALDVLTEVERDVVLLRVLAGLDTAQVAAVVGKRRGNVRVIQTRALAKLRDALIRRGYGPDDAERHRT